MVPPPIALAKMLRAHSPAVDLECVLQDDRHADAAIASLVALKPDVQNHRSAGRPIFIPLLHEVMYFS